jgi:hypothetical protein
MSNPIIVNVGGSGATDASGNPIDPSANTPPAPPTGPEMLIQNLGKLSRIAPGMVYGGTWLYYTNYQFGGDLNIMWLLLGGAIGAVIPFGANWIFWTLALLASWTVKRGAQDILDKMNAGERSFYIWAAVLVVIAVGLYYVFIQSNPDYDVSVGSKISNYVTVNPTVVNNYVNKQFKVKLDASGNPVQNNSNLASSNSAKSTSDLITNYNSTYTALTTIPSYDSFKSQAGDLLCASSGNINQCKSMMKSSKNEPMFQAAYQFFFSSSS